MVPGPLPLGAGESGPTPGGMRSERLVAYRSLLPNCRNHDVNFGHLKCLRQKPRFQGS